MTILARSLSCALWAAAAVTAQHGAPGDEFAQLEPVLAAALAKGRVLHGPGQSPARPGASGA